VPGNEDLAAEPPAPELAAVLAQSEKIAGWLTRAQAASLFAEARRLPAGSRIVEIGSHQGRSTVVLALAARSCHLVAIDPFVEGALFGGLATKLAFLANLAAANVADRVVLREAKSTVLRLGWRDRIDLLYIDGKHDYWTLSDDLKWSEYVPEGGIVLIHDAFSSIGVTLGLLRHVLFSRRLRYLDRTTSLARCQLGRPSSRDRLRLLAQLPWWLRNIAIKLLLRVARLFGNSTPDPY
jgi:predicted O-methyltransferase YrrM